MAILKDTQQECTSITLPKSGVVPVGVDLTDINLTVLQQEVRQFYGNRFVVVDSQPDPPVASPAASVGKPESRRKRKQT